MSRLNGIVGILDQMVDAAEALDHEGVMAAWRLESGMTAKMYPKWNWAGNGPVHEAIQKPFTHSLEYLAFKDSPQDYSRCENGLKDARVAVDNLRLGSDRLDEMARLFGRMYLATAAGDVEEFDELHTEYNVIGDEMFGKDNWANHVVGYIFDQARNDLVTYPMLVSHGEDFEESAVACLNKASDRIELIYPCL